MTSSTNTAGLEVVAWTRRVRETPSGAVGVWLHPTTTPEVSTEHMEAMELVTAASAQARIAELEADRDRQKRRGDNHWETLRSIREFAREGDCERIILWVNDAGSGSAESIEQTLGQMTDRATAAEARADRLARALRCLRDSCIRTPVGAGDGGTFVVSPPTRDALSEATAALQQEPTT